MKIKICIFIISIKYFHANQQPYNNAYNINHQPQYNYYPQQPSHQSKQQQQQHQQQSQYSHVNPNQLTNDSLNANSNINSSPYYHHNPDPYHIDHNHDDDDLNDISSNRSKSSNSNSNSYENNNNMKFSNNHEYYQSKQAFKDNNSKNFMTTSSITDDVDKSSSISMNIFPTTTTTTNNNNDINDKYKYYDLPTYSSVPTNDNDVSHSSSSSLPTMSNNDIDEYGDYRNNNNNQQQLQQQQQQQQQQQHEDGNNNYLQNEELSQLDKDFIFEGLKQLYKKKVLPIEINSKFSHFSSPPMSPSDFDAKPMVLIIGQYSVGKTSFIRSLLKQDFPGQRIGPEPTTDRFTAIMYPSSEAKSSSPSSLFSSPSSFFQSSSSSSTQQTSSSSSSSFIPPMGKLLPGHALVMQANKPFRGLASFGNNFLSKFEGAEVYSSILQNITIIDTPGIQ
jgi:hypothetical protein